MISKMITINNDTGLHARPASLFVKTAAKFKSEVMLQKGDKRINGKSIMAVLALGVSKGADVTISADGIDEEEALNELLELVSLNFNE